MANDRDDVDIHVPGAIPKLISAVIRPFRKHEPPSQSEPQPVLRDDSDEYCFTHSKRGKALIFNNEYFKMYSSRPGSSQDARNLSRVLQRLGFEVECLHNQTKSQMKRVLKKVSKEDHSDEDCILIAVLSHGDQVEVEGETKSVIEKHDVVYATNGTLLTRDMVHLFTDDCCPSLIGKPRIFLIQACRGTTLDPGVEVNLRDEVDATISSPVITPAPLYKDFLIMYATPPGHYAFRRPDTGSWFIKAFCDVFSGPDVSSTEIQKLLTRVIKKVSFEYESHSKTRDLAGKKQTSCSCHMLIKDIYFRVDLDKALEPKE
ncbi:hypothetical protein CHS0354_033255 [Potamilus streckersoni]|uniref:Uncharacterized protein n=1 Tax=Potamilus streckersoni TaxID=2493646 RepID=A0AAE0S692_9BIVA|nr:hypothetical protein CHS0354_033255 [Potamilus streckersoni]